MSLRCLIECLWLRPRNHSLRAGCKSLEQLRIWTQKTPFAALASEADVYAGLASILLSPSFSSVSESVAGLSPVPDLPAPSEMPQPGALPDNMWTPTPSSRQLSETRAVNLAAGISATSQAYSGSERPPTDGQPLSRRERDRQAQKSYRDRLKVGRPATWQQERSQATSNRLIQSPVSLT